MSKYQLQVRVRNSIKEFRQVLTNEHESHERRIAHSLHRTSMSTLHRTFRNPPNTSEVHPSGQPVFKLSGDIYNAHQCAMPH